MSRIQTKYYRGEVKLYSRKRRTKFWAVDGFAESEKGQFKAYEFMGNSFMVPIFSLKIFQVITGINFVLFVEPHHLTKFSKKKLTTSTQLKSN